jgi:hypothetical protein
MLIKINPKTKYYLLLSIVKELNILRIAQEKLQRLLVKPRTLQVGGRNFLMSKFKDILVESRDGKLPEEELSEDNDGIAKEQRVAIRKNELAMANSSMTFTTDKAINIVYAAFTEGWSEGRVYLVVRKLMKKYRPLDNVSKIEMRQQLARIKMKKGTDPSILFEELTSIQNQYLGPGKRLDKAELIAIILDMATEEYRAILLSSARSREIRYP